MAAAGSREKDAALAAIANALDTQREALAAANARDLQAGRDSGLDAAQLDRLALTPARIDAMNVLAANLWAMSRAVLSLSERPVVWSGPD